jgi:uncharacterized protein
MVLSAIEGPASDARSISLSPQALLAEDRRAASRGGASGVGAERGHACGPPPSLEADGAIRVARLSVKVVPKASRDALDGWVGHALKVRVTAPPERGKANAAVEALLAGALGLRRAQVRIIAGQGAPRKAVEIEGLSEEDVRARLGAMLESDDFLEAPRASGEKRTPDRRGRQG